MTRLAPIALLVAALACGKAAASEGLVEPNLTVAPGKHHGPRVVLTLDACSGAADERILHALIEDRVHATIFATAIWLRRNPAALAELNAHPELFEIENHGARHRVAADRPMTVFGVQAAGSIDALRTEIDRGAEAVKAATGKAPRWYRGATGKYSRSAIELIAAMNYRLAGYSIAADGGAKLDAKTTAHRIASALDGAVILAHVNQPHRSAGLGVIAGIRALEAKGFVFLRLEDAAPLPIAKHKVPTS